MATLAFALAALVAFAAAESFSEEWDGGPRPSYPPPFACTSIPANFSLCKNIGYFKMMVPNLLGHDSLQEAEYHAKAWNPLIGLQCHPDTQLFLCSLFAPICLDRPIYPCRSLCQGVQKGCEPRMLTYKYPWPSMLSCDQFPEDHDLCIRPGAANSSEPLPAETECPTCNQAHTCENIVDNFCRSDFVFRAKFKRTRGGVIEFRKGRWFKNVGGRKGGGRELRLGLEPRDGCCGSILRPGQPYLVMGTTKSDGNRTARLLMSWSGKDSILRNAVRTFRSMDCSNPLPMNVVAAGEEGGGRRRRRKQGGRRRGRNYGGCRVSTPPRNQ